MTEQIKQKREELLNQLIDTNIMSIHRNRIVKELQKIQLQINNSLNQKK